MTLKELLNLKLVYDNVEIKSGNTRYSATRIFGRPVTESDLYKAGVPEELFSYGVKAVAGCDKKLKVLIIVDNQDK